MVGGIELRTVTAFVFSTRERRATNDCNVYGIDVEASRRRLFRFSLGHECALMRYGQCRCSGGSRCRPHYGMQSKTLACGRSST